MSYNNYLFLGGEERGAFLAFTFRPPSGLPLSCPSFPFSFCLLEI